MKPNMAKVKTEIEYLKIFKDIHGDKYQYPSLTENKKIKSQEPIPIICREHGVFYQKIAVHLKGCGCKECFIGRCSKTKEQWLSDFKSKHGDRYEYPVSSWLNNVKNKTKIPIICREHGVFYQTANNHMTGANCPECGLSARSEKRRTSVEDWVIKFNEVHKGRYLYPTEEWLDSFNIYQNIPIICHEHGVFHQMVNHHRDGSGCPDCSGTNHVYAYIFNINDKCLKFGITGNIKKREKRLKQINKIKTELIGLWEFPSSNQARNAERKIYQNVEKVMSRYEMPDGYTETCAVDEYYYIVKTYEEMSGVRV